MSMTMVHGQASKGGLLCHDTTRLLPRGHLASSPQKISFTFLRPFLNPVLLVEGEGEKLLKGKNFCCGGKRIRDRMKIQCSVCEAAEAKVLCCADEAALCWECDEKVHAANKLANKHQRVPLFTSSSDMPKCDICQETVGFFFCLEDRALLCRKCDVAVHTANSYVYTHQRFLLTGVRVGLEATEPGASSSSAKSQSEEKMSDTKSSSVSRKVSSIPQSSECNEVLPIQVGGVGEFPPNKVSYGGGSTSGNISQWPIEEFLGLNEFSQNYSYMDNRPSKADSGKLEDSDSPGLRSSEEEMDDDDCLGRVPDSSWTVPQIPSPPTASGLYWPKDPRYSSDSALFAPVPNISFSQIR